MQRSKNMVSMKVASSIAILIFASFSIGMPLTDTATGCGDGAMQDLGDWSNNDFFKNNSGYNAILRNNVNMVKEASEKASTTVKEWLKKHPKESLTFLDVASGTDTPIVSRNLFDVLHKMKVSVKYTAIDINQKLADVRAFQFPANVAQQTLVVGDAYHVNSKEVTGKKFSIIYFGLNLHHLSPQELAKVLRDYKGLLEKDGLFIIFDVIRPEEALFVERPKAQTMIAANLLKGIPSEPVVVKRAKAGDDWRAEFAQTFGGYAESRGVDETTVKTVQDHILGNDYPLSMSELTQLLKQTGFSVRQVPFSPEFHTPVAKYFGMLVASQDK